MSDIEVLLGSALATLKSIRHAACRLSVPAVFRQRLVKLSGRQSLANGESLSTTSQQRQQQSLSFHLHTLLLFTWSDLKNILIPQTLLALTTVLCCSQPLSTSASNATKSVILLRLPYAIIWVWLHLLVFNTSNQSQPSSQIEDLENKPWRPLPAKRLTHSQARGIFFISSALALHLSLFTGGIAQSLLLMFLYILNNDLSLGDTSAVTRNILNASGYTTFALGAISVLTHGLPSQLTNQGHVSIGLLAAVILSTGQCQDLEDQDGDRAKDRHTIPLVFGDAVGRYSVAVPMAIWTVVFPRFWNSGYMGSVFIFGTGAVVIKRLIKGDKEGYRKTFKLWNCWIIALYLLPAFGRR